MSFSSDNGYIPQTFDALMSSVREGVNTQFGMSYTVENFVGTNFYKFFYSLIQKLQENEIKTSEIFLRLQEYFNITNEMIQRPNTTHPGIYDFFKSKGYFVSTKPPIDADAGKAFICVDVKDNHARGTVEITNFANLVSGTDDSVTIGATVFTAQTGSATLGTATFRAAISNEATAESLAIQINAHATAGALVEAWVVGAKVYIRAVAGGTSGNSIVLAYTDNDSNVGAVVSGATLADGFALGAEEVDYNVTKPIVAGYVKDCVVAGVISQGTEIEEITMTNNQSFQFKFNLPNRIPIILRLTITQSDNNLFSIDSPDTIKEKLYANLLARYRLGKNFEPQRYYSVVDAPWASETLLEWSDDNGSNWYSTIYLAAYDEVFTFDLTDIEVVEV